MSSRQYVLGYQLGEDKQIVRVELYDKRYRDLVGLTRDKNVVGGGVGKARGADVFVRRNIGPWFNARATYTYVDSRRTDPSSGVVTRAPFDITNSITLIGDQALPKGWDVSFAFRYATGKPFTPIVGSTLNPRRHIRDPIYGYANSDRLPPAQKLDLSMSRVTRLSPRTMLVYFFSLDNVLDRENVYQYTYNADYSRRIPVRSLFNRSFYIGASLTHYELVR
jgi:vitamin B12 transporter